MLLYVKVKPHQRLDKVEKTEDGWQIRIQAPAVDGKANEHLIRYLAEILGISRSKIELKKGQTSKLKCLDIALDETTVQSRLVAASM